MLKIIKKKQKLKKKQKKKTRFMSKDVNLYYCIKIFDIWCGLNSRWAWQKWETIHCVEKNKTNIILYTFLSICEGILM